MSGKCNARGCDNAADPRWFFHVLGEPMPACDAHGCSSGDLCQECREVAEASTAASKVLDGPWPALDGTYECRVCRDSFAVPFGLEPTALCSSCAQDAAQSLAEAVLLLTRIARMR